MALPRLNESPQYELVIPSSGETVNYRPFLVKEQKVLLIAYESQDQKQIVNSILQCISACLEQEIDVSKLSTFDADYIFTTVRSKSVGEKVSVNAKCSSCEHANEIEINLENMKLEGEVKPISVEITEDIHLKMKYPTYHDLITKTNIATKGVAVESIFEMITTCIDGVATQDEFLSVQDESREEIERFINSLTTDQFQKVRQFVETIPKITLEYEYTCEACNHVNKNKLEGLQDFFS